MSEGGSVTTGDGRTVKASPLLAYGVAANVKRDLVRGDGLEIQRGTKHFGPGVKVWVLPPRWGDGAQVGVVGRHRGSYGSYILLVMPRRHLEGFRVQGVYSPALFAAMNKPIRHGGSTGTSFGVWEDRETAERHAALWNRPAAEEASPSESGVPDYWTPGATEP